MRPVIPKTIGHVVTFEKGLKGLFKRGMWEIPEIMGAHAMSLIGFALAGIGLYNYAKDNGENREFKLVYYIVREGDPKGLRLRNPVHTCYNQEEEDERSAITKARLPKKSKPH